MIIKTTKTKHAVLPHFSTKADTVISELVFFGVLKQLPKQIQALDIWNTDDEEFLITIQFKFLHV